jgi:hypothetical protein
MSWCTLSIDKTILTANIRTAYEKRKVRILAAENGINISIKQWMHQMYLAARDNDSSSG